MKHSVKLIPFVIAFSAATAMAQAPRDKSAPEASSKPAGREVLINLTNRQMTIKQGDTVLASYPIAIGQAGYPTPTGEFHVIDRDDNPTGAPDISGRWLGFLHTTTKHGRAWLGIHGTQNTQSIGRPASHGCIRLRIPDAIEALQPARHRRSDPHRRPAAHPSRRPKTQSPSPPAYSTVGCLIGN